MDKEEELRILLEELKKIGEEGIDGNSHPTIDTVIKIYKEKLMLFMDKHYSNI